jgi:tetratricopeptide (TPR) repeat protein
MLQARSQRQQGCAERIGTHLLRGGEALEALSYFLHAAEERFNQGAFHQVAALLGDWEQAMVEEGMPASEPMWGRGWLLRGRVRRALGRLEEASQVIARAMKVSEEQGWPDIVAACLGEEGIVLHRLGETERGWKRLRKAESAARTLGDDELMAHVLNGQGIMLAGQGQLDDALAAFERFRELSARIGDKGGEAESYFQLGQVDKQAGRLELAQVRLSQSLELFESLGARWGMAKAVNELGEIARLENRLSEAESCYRLALEKMDELGLIEATVPRLNLALVMIQQEKFGGAMPLIEHAHETFERSGSRARRGLTHLMLLICGVGQGHWIDWEYHMAEARGILADTGFVDVDLAMCAVTVGDLAAAQNFMLRASEAWDLALDQWLSLDRPAEAGRVRQRIRAASSDGKLES